MNRRLELALATAAALVAYLLAYLPPTPAGLRWGAIGLAAGLAFAARGALWTRVPARVARWTSLGVRLLLVVTCGLVVFARQFPLVQYASARRTAIVVGGVLAAAALVFLAGRPIWRVPTNLLPAVAGVLVAAGMENGGSGFLPLAAGAGLALWIDAFRTGGPRRPGVALALSSAAAAALTAGIVWFLPLAQPHVQEFVARAYSEGGRTGLSDRSELGEVESLAQSRRIVARVWTDHPQRLRMQVFARFDGRRWAAFAADARRMHRIERPRLGPLLATLPGEVFAGGVTAVDPAGLAETRVLPDLWMEDGWGLLAPSAPALVVWPDEGLAVDDRGLVTTGGVTARLYGVANRPARGTASGPVPDDLALPPRIDPRLRALAQSLRAGEEPGPRLVARTVEHLRSRYRYTLQVGRFVTADPLAEFLFDKRAGYCEYFATAAVVLLRLQGVPARYVKGVSVRPDRLVGDHYVVRESDAHAWADVWTADAGWSEVDPTPADGWAQTHPQEHTGLRERIWEAVAPRVSQAWAWWRQGTWPWLQAVLARVFLQLGPITRAQGWAVAVASIVVAGLLVVRRRRAVSASRPRRVRAVIAPELAAALGRIERLWARAGQARSPSRGLVEHFEALPADALSADARDVSRRVIDAVYGSAFGAHRLADAELSALVAAARALPR